MTIEEIASQGASGEAAFAVEADRHARAVLILGMHRSGTSAAAGLCKYLGCEIPGDLVPAAVDNPKGFFENAKFVAFNDRLLDTLGSRYDEPAGITTEQMQGGRDLGIVGELARLLSDELGRAPLVVVKDPRICRLAPIWIDALEAVGRQVSTLQPLRHPLEVAESLLKRNGFSQTQGLLMWLDHVLAAERASRGRARSFVLYHDLLGDWRTSAAKISNDLSLIWPRSIARAEADIDGFITGDLRHHQAKDQHFTSGNALHALVARTWNALGRLSTAPSDAEASAELDAVRASLDAAEILYGGYISASQKLLLDRFDRIVALEQHAAHMEHVVERANDTAKMKADALSSSLAASRAETAAAVDEAGVLAASLETVRTEAASARTEAAAVTTSLEELRKRHLTAQTEFARILDLLRATEAQLGVMQNSVSWRLGMPIRVVGRSLPASLRYQTGRVVRAVHRRLRAAVFGPTPEAPVVTNKDGAPAAPSMHATFAAEDADTGGMRESATYYMSPTPDQLQTARSIIASCLFDPKYYAVHDASLTELDQVLHYVVTGEKQGFRPSPLFDPEFYGERYPDVAESMSNLFVHFVQYGMAEGRRGTAASANMPFQGTIPDPSRKTVLILAHEASRTGAPILAWNLAKGFHTTHNVIVLLMRGGEFESAFEREVDVLVGPVGDPACFDAMEARFAIREVLKRYRIDFCIANSVETREYAIELERSSVPVVALVHEFSTYYRPPGMLHELYETASKVVFPAKVVRDVSCAEYEAMRRRHSEILPQGPSTVPPSENQQETTSTADRPAAPRKGDDLRARLRPKGTENAFLVLGMGTVQQRKGVDLFIAAAAAARLAAPEQLFRFIWIGHGYKPDQDLQYSVYLHAQIQLSGLAGSLEIMDNVDDLEPVYSEMDALMMSSRLDPLPNVSIDAALRGIPVVCFAGASGMAEILATDPMLKDLVVPHLDSTSAGRVLADLATNKARLHETGGAIRQLGNDTFDMSKYIQALSRLGEDAIEELRQIEVDRQYITSTSDAFDRDLYTGEVLPELDAEKAITHYLTQTSHRNDKAPQPYAYSRRPLAGFNPVRYAEEHASRGVAASRDPLVDYLVAGRPAGPWAHNVIRPTDSRIRPSSPVRVGVHGHFHYPELLPEFIDRLEANASAVDLILTTDLPEKVQRLEREVTRFEKGEVAVLLMPNAGRDVGPFLTGLREVITSRYDIIGHMHGKRSVHTQAVDETYGDRWREFLWEHLVGGRSPMADVILARFNQNPHLGLVFPEDPNIVGWDGSDKMGYTLAQRLKIPQPLPASFDFPNGTMFWARTAALKPLFDLGLDWSDYPSEPLPKDGTLLHALERLIPFVIEASGYNYETTQVPGVFR